VEDPAHPAQVLEVGADVLLLFGTEGLELLDYSITEAERREDW